jgi:transcriptional regulator with XRE-family HTH domain
MTQHADDRPAARPVETIARRVREVRRRRGLSAAQLAERLREVGIPWDRNIVANLETGRRASVDVGELLALADALNVAPVHLLIPPNEPDEGERLYQVTPTRAAPVPLVRAWARGELPLPGTSVRGFYSEVPEQEFRPPPGRQGDRPSWETVQTWMGQQEGGDSTKEGEGEADG